MAMILLQCIAGYGGGLPQKLHLTLVSPLAVVVVNTSTPVGGEVSVVIDAIIHIIIYQYVCHHLPSPMSSGIVNTSTPVGGEVSVVISLAIIDRSSFVITNVSLLAVVNVRCQHFNACGGRC